MDGPQSRRWGKEKNLFPCLKLNSDSSAIQPIAHRYIGSTQWKDEFITVKEAL
jgi:hypothetical protein